jgi:uncharacterized protein with von Willebrand factor type A (vWA) domain
VSTVGATADLAEVAGRLGTVLRAAGVPVTPERSGRFAAALQLALPATTDELYWAGRVTLLSDHAHVEVYDRVFAQLFGGLVDWADSRGDAASVPPPVQSRPGETRPPSQGDRDGATSTQPSPAPATGEGGGDGDTREVVLAAVSDEERLRSRDFGTLTPEELALLRSAFQRLALAPPPRRVRRDRRAPGGPLLDLRGTLARAHRTAGDPVRQVRRARRTRPRRLVLLCDISGSMEPYARAYLQLLHSAVGGARAEAFVFATRLTRLTRSLAVRSPDLALRRAAAVAPDWSGGTRIGRAVQEFNDRYGRRGMARGAVVVLVSDGWERDDPELLGREVERLSRLAHRIVWVNPRSASPRFAPLTAGMAAAIPHVDALVSGHSVGALDEVLEAIAGP